jgi:AmmeMemoRadiSam system protein B
MLFESVALSLMQKVRPPAVAGTFYPGDPKALRKEILRYLETTLPPEGLRPKGAIVPHAGYVYSGPVAATAYAALAPLRGIARRVVLVGPSHRVPFDGLAIPTAEAFDTPLGRVTIDQDALDRARTFPCVVSLDEAHAHEHSLEVQLPFLQETLGPFELAPFAVGSADGDEVARVIDALWGGSETVVVISSDLSHYHDYETARRLDRATARAIEELRPEQIEYDDACGRDGIRGLLLVARRRGLEVQKVDLRNSGDTAGPRDQVVGYGSFLVLPA